MARRQHQDRPRGRQSASRRHAVDGAAVAPDGPLFGLKLSRDQGLAHQRSADLRQMVDFALFTGHLSAANIRLYERAGYTETRRQQLAPGVVLVHLEKPAT